MGCKSHTHAANIKLQPNACSSCFKQYFPFLLGGGDIVILNPLPVLEPVLVVLKIQVQYTVLQEILLFTRSLMINTRPLIGCLKNTDLKSINYSVFATDCFKTSCLLFSDTMSYMYMQMYLVLQHDSRFVSQNCHATQLALTEWLGSTGL